MVQALKDLEQPFTPVLWQSNDAFCHIHYPTQDLFLGVIVSVTSFHLFDGRNVFAVLGIKGVQGMEHFVNGVQEAPQVLAALLEAPLQQGDAVINTNVVVS